MNHFYGLVFMSLSIGVVFALINKDSLHERFGYFLSLMAYMIIGSLLAVWLMQVIPW